MRFGQSADGVTYDNEVAKGEFTEADYNRIRKATSTT